MPAGEGRSIFALPWFGRSLIGTTDNDYEADSLEHVPPSQDDVAYLLDAVNATFATELTSDDVVGAFAGVRPLIAPAEGKRSVDISRKAELYETSSGMVTITGGKLTTWRHMAEMTVDRIVERAGDRDPCRTLNAKIGVLVNPDDLTRVEGVPEESYGALADRYGAAAEGVLTVAGEDGRLAQPIIDGPARHPRRGRLVGSHRTGCEPRRRALPANPPGAACRSGTDGPFERGGRAGCRGPRR